MAVFSGGAIGTLVRLVCPYCGEVQARARKPARRLYACRRCRRRFDREEGTPKARKR